MGMWLLFVCEGAGGWMGGEVGGGGVGMAGGVVGWWVCMKVCMVLNKNNCHFQANQTHFLFQIGNICSQAAVSMMHPSLKDMALQNMVMEKVGTTRHQSLQTEPAALSHAIAYCVIKCITFQKSSWLHLASVFTVIDSDNC